MLNMRNPIRTCVIASGLGAAALLSACNTAHTPTEHVVGDPVEKAVAIIRPTAGNTVTGRITFTQQGDGARVEADLTGLPEGTHAYHVHLWGDCSGADGKTAGTHFNFEGSTINLPEDAKKRITGNLGDLEVGSDGIGKGGMDLPTARLNGPLSIVGRSVIVHAKGNDHSQPPIGAAGARLGCGVIGAAKP